MNEGSDRDNVIRVGFGVDGKLTRASSPEPAPSQPAPPRSDPRDGLYTVAEVARLFGYKPSRLRYWHRSGVLGPSARVAGRNYYTFQDLVGVRAAKGLLEQGVPLQQVRRSVESLREAFPQTYVFSLPSRRGLVVVASTTQKRETRSNLIAKAKLIDRRFETPFSFEDMVRRMWR